MDHTVFSAEFFVIDWQQNSNWLKSYRCLKLEKNFMFPPCTLNAYARFWFSIVH